jgi:RHS repeat-associated protein
LNDVIGRLTSILQNNATLESYTYLGLGAVVERDHPEGTLKLSYLGTPVTTGTGAGDIYAGLDRFGRVADQKWTHGATVVDWYHYAYDRDSNVTEKDNEALLPPLNPNLFDETYGYDGLNRLVSVTRGGSAYQSFGLDAVGNITSVTGTSGTDSRTINSLNQLTSTGVSGSQTIVYDAGGNMAVDDQGRQYQYDAWNRLIAVNDTAGMFIKGYAYDGLGRRVSETVLDENHEAVTTTLYYSTAGQVLETYVGEDAQERDVYSPVYVNAAVLRDNDLSGTPARVYFTCDANYNTTSVISTAGAALQHQVYTSYGEVSFRDPTTWNDIGSDSYTQRNLFQGMLYDAVIGWYFTPTRMYSPTLQVWNRMDPIRADGMNWYVPFAANPINRVDPNGTETESSTAKVFKRESLKLVFGALKDFPDRAIKDLGNWGFTSVEMGEHIDKMKGLASALVDLWGAFVTDNAQQRATHLTNAIGVVGEQEVKAIMKAVATHVGEGLGFSKGVGNLYAAVLIDAWKTGDAIGQKMANMLDDAMVESVYTTAKNNPNLTPGSMAFQRACGGTARFGFLVFKDHNGVLWVHRPKVYSALSVIVRTILRSPDEYEWVSPPAYFALVIFFPSTPSTGDAVLLLAMEIGECFDVFAY